MLPWGQEAPLGSFFLFLGVLPNVLNGEFLATSSDRNAAICHVVCLRSAAGLMTVFFYWLQKFFCQLEFHMAKAVPPIDEFYAPDSLTRRGLLSLTVPQCDP